MKTMLSRSASLAKPNNLFLLSSASHRLISPSLPLKRIPNHPLPRLSYGVYAAIHNETISSQSVVPKDQSDSNKQWSIKMLYDGDCPLCMKEVNMLRERNKTYGTIKFVDISSEEYSPEENGGLDYETVMGKIHAIQHDGTVYTNVEAFRRLYEEVGLGWVYSITKYQPFASIAGAVYAVWAKYRLPITGRPSLETILDQRKSKAECDKNCKV